jgi:hypothetical protein
MSHRTADEAKKSWISVMGEAFGLPCAQLWQEIAYLHQKWMQYLILFGTDPERVELLNDTAPAFFRLVQDLLWNETILHIARITDPCETVKGKSNLTIQILPKLLTDDSLRNGVQALVNKALTQSEFCRDWRNKHIAHSDLRLALGQPAAPLKNGSRKQVNDILQTLAETMNLMQGHYLDSETHYKFDCYRGGASDLLEVLKDGVMVQQEAEAGLATTT